LYGERPIAFSLKEESVKKIINSPDRFVLDMLEGIYAAHPHELTFTGDDMHCLVNARRHAGKLS
jgi:dihydroxyacetone kinase-like protein